MNGRTLIILISVALLVIFGARIYATNNKRGATTTASPTAKAEKISNVACESMEGNVVHFHVHLQFAKDGSLMDLPSNIGIREDAGCFYWLHTHDDDNIIHVESPINTKFTLGQFFDVWGKPLSKTEAGDIKAAEGKDLFVYVDGKEYTGEPREIELKPRQQLVIAAGKPITPPAYSFPPNL